MSNGTEYGIVIQIKKGLENLKKLRKNIDQFEKTRERVNKAQNTALAKQMVMEQGMYRNKKAMQDKIDQALEESNKKQIKRQHDLMKIEQTRAKRIREEKIKSLREQGSIQSARRVQAVGNITAPTGAEGMRSYYKQLEKDAKQVNKAEEKRIRDLHAQRRLILESTFMLKKNVTEQERLTQQSIREALARATTAKEARNLARAAKNNTAELRKQNFLMGRMQASSKELAGNMVSAFAVAGTVGGIMQTGQAFESVNNTLLSVSGNAELAGQQFQFVRDQAMRLGTPLAEGAKQFAKMMASAGDTMEQSTIEQSFIGLSEMSTVLGLSADESGRAFTALTQIMSKNQVMA